MRKSKAAAGTASALAVAALAGCAGNQPLPSASIDEAEQRIEEAERAEAQRYASTELNTARERLLAAREAQQEGDEEEAARLAQEAELDAAYAAAVADNEAAQVAVQELRETIATLESELDRQQDAGFPPAGDELGIPDAERAPQDPILPSSPPQGL